MKLIGILTIRSAAYTTVFAMLAAITAQVFPNLPYYDTLYAFCNPLRTFGALLLLRGLHRLTHRALSINNTASLYTLSLFTTLSIGETVQKTLSNHVSEFQVSHTSTGHLSAGAAPLGIAQIAMTRPISVRVDSDYGQPAEESKAFEWAKGRGESL